jgi:hypothetical protein
MSNSKKKPISKDNIHIETKQSTWRKFRRKVKKSIKDYFTIDLELDEEPLLPNNSRELVSPYNLNDWISNCENTDNCYCVKKYGRKKCAEK